jgi:hypothetical protein
MIYQINFNKIGKLDFIFKKFFKNSEIFHLIITLNFLLFYR